VQRCRIGEGSKKFGTNVKTNETASRIPPKTAIDARGQCDRNLYPKNIRNIAVNKNIPVKRKWTRSTESG
jgi:hypothetical protein